MSQGIDRTILDKVRVHQQELAEAHGIEEVPLKRIVRRTDKHFAMHLVREVREARKNRPQDAPAPRPRKPRRGFGK